MEIYMGDKSLNLTFQVTKPSEGLEKGFNLRSLRGSLQSYPSWGPLYTPASLHLPSVSSLLHILRSPC